MDQIIGAIVALFPSLSIVVGVLLVAWFFSSENRKMRAELDGQVEKAVDARLGQAINSIQARAIETDRLFDDQKLSAEQLQKNFGTFASELASKEKSVNELFQKITKRLGKLEDAVPDVEGESAEDLMYRVQAAEGKAAASLSKILLDHQDATSAQLEITGDSMRKSGRYSLARDLYSAAHDRDPERVSAELELRSLEAEYDFSARKAALERIKAITLESPEYLGRVCDVFIEISDNQGLLDYCQLIEREWAADQEIKAKAIRNRAVALRRLRRTDEAIEAFDEALQLSPDDENVLRAYLPILKQVGDTRRTTEVLETLTKLDPADPDYCVDMAELCLKNRDLTQAQFWLDRGRELGADQRLEFLIGRLQRKLTFAISDTQVLVGES